MIFNIKTGLNLAAVAAIGFGLQGCRDLCDELNCSSYNTENRTFSCWEGYDYYNNEYAVCYPDGDSAAVEACNDSNGMYFYLTNTCWPQYTDKTICDSSSDCTEGDNDACLYGHCYSNPSNGSEA